MIHLYYRPYSLPEIIQEKYKSNSSYPQPNTVRLRDFLVKAGRGSQGRREAGEEKNYENNLLSSPAYPNRIDPQPILDWSQTRKVNGKIVSDLRKQTKQRLISQGGDEFENAVVAKETVDKYWQHKDREYQQYQQ